MNGHLICYKSQDIDDELMHAKTVCNKFGMKFKEVQNFTLSEWSNSSQYCGIWKKFLNQVFLCLEELAWLRKSLSSKKIVSS